MKDIVFWLRKFVMIYGIIMICTFFMCYFFNPTSTLPVVSFFGRIIIFTILGMLTLFVYYSKEEFTPKTMVDSNSITYRYIRTSILATSSPMAFLVWIYRCHYLWIFHIVCERIVALD